MKREALTHPKTFDLAARLNCSRPEAIGYLTLLWDFTATQAPQGNVGKWPDGAIARACDWPGEPSEFVRQLIDSGWIDVDDQHRLLIHDWEKNCERWVTLKVEKLKLSFIGSTVRSTEATTERSIEDTAEPSPSRDQSNPIQSNPIPKPKLRTVGAFSKLVTDELTDDRRLAKRYRRCVEEGCIDQSDTSFLNFFAAAERAIETGTDPPAMFRSIAETKNWKVITQAQEDRARARISRLRRTESPSANGAVAELAAKLVHPRDSP